MEPLPSPTGRAGRDFQPHPQGPNPNPRVTWPEDPESGANKILHGVQAGIERLMNLLPEVLAPSPLSLASASESMVTVAVHGPSTGPGVCAMGVTVVTLCTRRGQQSARDGTIRLLFVHLWPLDRRLVQSVTQRCCRAVMDCSAPISESYCAFL